MEQVFEFADQLGPTKIIHVYEPSVNLKAILVVDNVAMGPSIGGLRMAEDVSTEECFRLARSMTLKNSAAGLRHGGGKSVMFGDPKMPKEEKEQLIRAMACALVDINEYIFGPDMGTDEECMAWVHDEIHRAVGLPRELGGIPLDELGATAWGMSHATDVALKYCDLELNGARVVVQGFGSVGMHAARFLKDKGAVLIAAADSQGTIVDEQGLDVDALIAHKQSGKSLNDFAAGDKRDRDAVIDVECDIWIPAARPDVINNDSVDRLNTKLIVQGANIPITLEAEEHLYKKGVLYIPDFIANAGGVICAAMEYENASERVAFDTIAEKVSFNTEQVLAAAKKEQITPRNAAINLAVARVEKAMTTRRWSIF
jgi:glutamate dehydrogenase (NAD(P)+)